MTPFMNSPDCARRCSLLEVIMWVVVRSKKERYFPNTSKPPLSLPLCSLHWISAHCTETGEFRPCQKCVGATVQIYSMMASTKRKPFFLSELTDSISSNDNKQVKIIPRPLKYIPTAAWPNFPILSFLKICPYVCSSI